MWIAMSVAPEVVRFQREHEFSWNAVGIQLPAWLFAGFLWGAVMKFWMNRKGKESNKAPDPATTSIPHSGET